MSTAAAASAVTAVTAAASATAAGVSDAAAAAASAATAVAATLAVPVQSLDLASLAAIAAALGWASGLRLYAVVFLTGLAGSLGWVPLPSGLSLLAHPVVLVASGLMLGVEFLADKIPGVDSVWDAVHTVIRIPAGAALAAAAFGGDHQAWALVAALAGGTLAAAAHTAKATTRAAVNTSPEPLSNLGLSLAGDLAVPGMLWLAWEQPTAFFAALAVAVLGGLVLTVLLLRFLRAVLRRAGGWFSSWFGGGSGRSTLPAAADEPSRR